MKRKYVLVALGALMAVSLASGQTQQAQQPGGAASAAAGTKIGVISIRGAIVNTAEGKQAQAELQSQFTPRQTELENLRKQGQDLQKRLQDGERTLNDEEKNRLARQIQRLAQMIQRKEEDIREDLANAENDVVDRIGSKMMEVINRYARENGYAVILDVSGQGNVIYASNTVDITQDIIRLYDQAHPVSGAPAQPRPQQPGQTRPPQQPPAQKPPQS